MEIDPVEDPDELAEIAKCEKQVPLTEFDRAQAMRREGEPRAYGFTLGTGPRPGKDERLRVIEKNEMNAVAGQARRVARMLCDKARYVSFGRKGPCGGLVAEWQHVVGGRRAVSKAEWDQRRQAWGEAAEPWCGWLVDAVSGKKYRDYQDGIVTVGCPKCGRSDIRIRLRRVQEDLATSAKTETLKIPV